MLVHPGRHRCRCSLSHHSLLTARQSFIRRLSSNTHGVAQNQHTSSQHTVATPFLSSPVLSSSTTYDAIIVGGGHNGLVCSAYLAARGLKVIVLERRHLVGGAAVTEEIFPKHKYSRASYLCSLFRPQIIADLHLKRYGLRFHQRNPSSFTPMLDGRSLLLGADMRLNVEQIAQFSRADAENYVQYEAKLSELTAFFEPLLDSIPIGNSPRTWTERVDQLRTVSQLAANARQLGRAGLMDFHEIMTAPAQRILDRWFQSEPLKATLATDAIIGAMVGPSTPGSAYVLFHHVMGEVEGKKGAWAYVEGGMGALSMAIAKSARDRHVGIYVNADVKEIAVRNGRASGVVLADGRVINGKVVVSNLTPHSTFLSLCPSSALTPDFRSSVRSIDTTSPVTKINLSLSRLPQFACMPQRHGEIGPEHRGTVHFVESCQQIDAAYNDAVNGITSKRPVIEMTIPSALDPTLAPPGKHVVSLFTQYTPYNTSSSDGPSWDPHQYAQSVFNLINTYIPDFTNVIEHYEVLTPNDLESIFGLTGGNIFHGSMGLDQLYWLRPVKGYAQYRSPVDGLYMCGSGCHPGGGVMGSAGKNAAKIIEYDWTR